MTKLRTCHPSLRYDRFGDFEGFWLRSEEGLRQFSTRERGMESIAHEAWRERIAVPRDFTTDFNNAIDPPVHTGLRRGNLLSLRWDHIDFVTNNIRLTDSTKNRSTLALPLNDTAIETLNALKEKSGNSPYVFVRLFFI